MAKPHRKKRAADRAMVPSQEVPEGKRRGPRRDRVIAIGLLTILCILAFANSFSNGFAFDDDSAIVRNPLIKRLADLPTLFTTDYWAGVKSLQKGQDVSGDLYRPLVLATFALNYAMGGLNPFGYHLVNLVLQIAVCALLYELARQLGLSQGAALAASALFAVHPLHTEAVTGIVGRAELLMALGVLAALHWYRQGVGPLKLRLAFGLASWGSFLVALLSKEQAMVLPALLVLSDLLEGKGPGSWKALFQSAWRWYVGYGLLLGAYLALRTAVLGHFFSARTAIPLIDNPLAHAAWFARVCTAVMVAGKYLWLFMWPAQFSADYSYNAIPVVTSLRQPAVLAGLAAWGGLLGLGAYSALRGSRRVSFAIGLTTLTFLPASNLLIPIGTIMGERLFYLPSLGLCLLIGVGWESVRAWAHRTGRLQAVTWGGLVVLVLLLVPLTLVTIARNRDWRDTKTLMERAVRVVPQSAKVHFNLGLFRGGDAAQALHEFETAIQIYPDYVVINGNLNAGFGSVLLRVGRVAEAIEALERAVALNPLIKAAHYNLGLAYLRQERWNEAEVTFRRELAVDIENPAAYNSLSFALRMQERYAEALTAAEEALRLNANFPEASYNRGRALEALGRAQEALASYEKALRLKPDMSVAQSRLDQIRRRLAR